MRTKYIYKEQYILINEEFGKTGVTLNSIYIFLIDTMTSQLKNN